MRSALLLFKYIFQNFYFLTIYLIVCAMQIAACYALFHRMMDMHWLCSVPIATLAGIIPYVGTALGMIGAIDIWNWPVWKAMVVMLLPNLLMSPVYVTVIINLRNARAERRRQEKLARSENKE